MQNLYHIRPVQKDDLRKVKTLLSKCNLPVDGVEDFFEMGYCVAETQDKLVGVAGVEVYCMHGLLRSVAVALDWQKKSIGQALVRNRLSWAKAKGFSDIYLITIDAETYFERFEFRSINRSAVPSEIQKSSEFSTICPETAKVMVRSL